MIFLKYIVEIVEKDVNKYAVKYITGQAAKHSTSRKLAAEECGKKEHFNDRRLSKEDVQLLFQLRKMILIVLQTLQTNMKTTWFVEHVTILILLKRKTTC